MKPANDNELGVALEWDVRHSFANLLRVMRGAGKLYAVVSDIEHIAKATSASAGDIDARARVAGAILSGLRYWHPDDYGHRDSREIAEHSICEAALRLVAAKLDDNHIQQTAAHQDLWRALGQTFEDRERQRQQASAEEYRERIDACLMREGQSKAIAAANDNVVVAAPRADSYVYFISDGEAIKIGKANNPLSRLAELQTSNHRDLSILAVTPGDQWAEAQLHHVFHLRRIRGEWFEDCAEIRSTIDDINSGKYVAQATVEEFAA